MDEKHILVSVVCAAFNHEAYIRETLENFVSQETDFAYEVLINDDCSTDGTADIIREFEAKYPDIIRPFYQEKNLYSQGIDRDTHVFNPNIRGKYVAFCEGDDHWCDNKKLQMQADFLEAHPDYSACVHNTYLHDCSGLEADTLLRPESGDRDLEFATIVKGMSNSYHTSSLMIRRELIVDPPDFHHVAYGYGFTDYAIALWAVLNGKIHFVDRPMSVYRINSNPHAWSSGVNGAYEKHKRFVAGEVAMLKTLIPHLKDEADIKAAERCIIEREFELLYIAGKDKELIKPPYLEIYREKDAKFRFKQFIKRNLPFIQRMHRKNRNYGD